jgi:hypothetical protein
MISKITTEHLVRGAVVYVRQSTVGQVAEPTFGEDREHQRSGCAGLLDRRVPGHSPEPRRREGSG